MTLRIPLARPEITESDRQAVLDVLRTPYLSMGPKLTEFERAICAYTGGAHAVVVNSGTSALQLAVRALGIERGSEVILPSFTFSALLNVILLEELHPKFVDIDPHTCNCTAEAVLAAITPATRLIIAVHTFGFPVDVEAIVQAVNARDGGRRIHVIEDACEALGADVRGRKAGTLGDAGFFAFYPNKQVTTGEGGMLVTSDEKVARKAAQLRNQGRDPSLGWNSHAEVGYSYRIPDINCALGISQLARIEGVVARRQPLAEMYDCELARIPEVVRPPLTSATGRISWFVYPIQLAAEFTVQQRDLIHNAMSRRGIATGRYFAPLHRQPVLASAWKQGANKMFTTEGTQAPVGTNAEEESRWSLPNTEFVADRVIALPFFNELTESEIQEVCGSLEESIREVRRKT
jgi:dTDP-4-amino-4,6-dideoxygalactose transaminase